MRKLLLFGYIVLFMCIRWLYLQIPEFTTMTIITSTFCIASIIIGSSIVIYTVKGT